MTRDAHKDQIEATGIAWQKQSPEYLVGYPDHVPAGKIHNAGNYRDATTADHGN